MRRLPPNTMPAQQHEATDETHTTEPYSILCYTPNPRPVREGRNTRLRIARCSMARARFQVAMSDRFWGHSARIRRRKRIDLASLQPRVLTAIFETGPMRRNV